MSRIVRPDDLSAESRAELEAARARAESPEGRAVALADALRDEPAARRAAAMAIDAQSRECTADRRALREAKAVARYTVVAEYLGLLYSLERYAPPDTALDWTAQRKIVDCALRLLETLAAGKAVPPPSEAGFTLELQLRQLAVAIGADTVVDEAPKQAKRRGRKPDTDRKQDKRIFDAWQTGQYKTYSELENDLGLSTGEAKRACDRHRKRRPKGK